MGRPTTITIHLDALRHNLNEIRKLAPLSFVLAMVKSNAYGHGLERIASALPDADAFGVACIEEGMRLRQANVQNPIVLLEGLFTGDELTKAAEQDFSLVVHHEDQVNMLEKSQHVQPLSVWLKIDTGMHRLGFEPNQVEKIYQRLMQCDAIKKPIVLMTHFAQSEASDRSATTKQIEIFNQTTQHLSGPRSLCNSGGIIGWPSAQSDWVRPGLILYGASPFPGRTGIDHQLKPVMSLTSELIAIHQIAKGEKIGYGGTWTCPEDMLVGVLAMGYGDGYPQFAKSGTPVLVNGQICPLIGRVSMDMSTVDLRTQPKAKVGDPVTLWGPGLPVEEVALNNSTTAYELLTRIAQRVHVIVR